jgi:PadR family transcriptional regulator, regulatory protein AphA
MSKTNKTRFAILGILSMGPTSGYGMKTIMHAATDHFWKEGDASIYPALKQLLEEDLIILKETTGSTARPKKTYAITNAGLAVLRDWLAAEPEYGPPRNELWLKLFFGWNSDPLIMINHLKEFHHKNELRIKKYRNLPLAKKAIAKQLTHMELYQYLTLNAGITRAEALSKWAEEAIQLLKATTKNNK